MQLRAAKEEEEKAIKKKHKAEEHMYTLIKVATEEDIRAQIGTTTHFDLVNYDSIKVHRVKKQTTFQDFKVRARAARTGTASGCLHGITDTLCDERIVEVTIPAVQEITRPPICAPDCGDC